LVERKRELDKEISSWKEKFSLFSSAIMGGLKFRKGAKRGTDKRKQIGAPMAFNKARSIGIE